MSTIERILDNYNRLCAYCDGFFSSIHSLYAEDMRCRRGCSACCKLHSVCALEAFVIARNKAAQKSKKPLRKKGELRWKCAMLKNKGCIIYAARPVICRTHGLAISIDKRKTVRPTCALNFSIKLDVRELPKPHVFDSAAVTGNLMRLNLAFCMAAGRPALASKRFTMVQVLGKALPKCIL